MAQNQLRIFVGYDPQETLGHYVFCYSVASRSTIPVSFHPITLKGLDSWWVRDRDPIQSNDFSFSRFLTPYLSGYSGWSLFCDGDMLCLADVSELIKYMDDRYAILVVKRPNPEEPASDSTKFLGRKNVPYRRKNWSSVVLYNNELCKVLDPETVRTAPGLFLHQFDWLPDELIGELPRDWNHLVGIDPPGPAKLVHFTLGLPPFHALRHCEYSEEWATELRCMMAHEFILSTGARSEEDL